MAGTRYTCICEDGGYVEALEGKSAFNYYYEIRCRVCGRQTAKHVRMEDAERDWQYMNEKAAREAESGGPEDGQADGGN